MVSSPESKEEIKLGEYSAKAAIVKGIVVNETKVFWLGCMEDEQVDLYISLYNEEGEDKFKEVAVKAVKEWQSHREDEYVKNKSLVTYVSKVLEEAGIVADIYSRVSSV